MLLSENNMPCFDPNSNEQDESNEEKLHGCSIKSVQDLPYDILFSIISTLSIRDLCITEKVSMLFNDISQKVLFLNK